MNTQTIKNTKPGFTLAEIMIVIVILGILMGITMKGYQAYKRRAQTTEAKSTMHRVNLDISSFHNDTNQYPASLEDLIRRPSNPTIAAKWTGNYTEDGEIPKDPWGEDFQYNVNPKGSKPPYDLYSFGPNGEDADQSEYIYSKK